MQNTFNGEGATVATVVIWLNLIYHYQKIKELTKIILMNGVKVKMIQGSLSNSIFRDCINKFNTALKVVVEHLI